MSDHPEATSDHDEPTTVATAPVTVEQAAAILGVSVTTVKRRIRAGSLRAEEARRPQGTVWLVYLPPAAHPAATGGQAPTSTVATAPTMAPAADAMVSLIQATIGTILSPLVGQLDAQRQTIERQADRVAGLERENGRLAAELARAHDEVHALTDSAASEAAQSTPRSPGAFLRAWARLDWLVVALVVTVVVVGVLLVVRR